MKNQIQQEAAKAAEAIREALEAFNKSTGLELKVSAEWGHPAGVLARSASGDSGVCVVAWVQGFGVVA